MARESSMEKLEQAQAAAWQAIRETQEQVKSFSKENKIRFKRMDEAYERTNKQIGYLGGSLGEVVELVLIPGIRKKMNDLGHNFTRMGPNKIFNKDNKTLAEIDLLLENGEESMAVEIKTDLSVKWVNKHLARLELLRKHESITGLRGKVLLSAVAGITIDEDARDLALEKGMYVIDMIEDENRLKVTAPKKSCIGRW